MEFSQERLIKGNSLIRDFMNQERILDQAGVEIDIPFHDKWELLMPVFDKINSFEGRNFNFAIFYHEGFICSDKIDFTLPGQSRRYNIQGRASTTIEGVWLTIVEFLEWHNEKIKQS